MAEKGQHMARTFVETDLGLLIHSSVYDPELRYVLEETLVEYTNEMFELGRQWQRGQNIHQEGSDYMRGFLDAISVLDQGGNLDGTSD